MKHQKPSRSEYYTQHTKTFEHLSIAICPAHVGGMQKKPFPKQTTLPLMHTLQNKSSMKIGEKKRWK
jgi:hypothetical protein